MKAKLVILSAPSGAGKSTIVRRLLQAIPELSFSVSATSRSTRPSEIDGKHYYFLSPEEFQEEIKKDAFLEWEEVYAGMYYGTLKSEVDRLWESGKQVAFDIDVEGGIKLKKAFGTRALAVFIQPPSLEVLEARLRGRGTETEESLAKRLGKAKAELGKADQFDTIIINDDLETAVADCIQQVEAFLKE